MTKSDIAEKIKLFILSQDDEINDEWWCTQREITEEVLIAFAEQMLNIRFEEEQND